MCSYAARRVMQTWDALMIETDDMTVREFALSLDLLREVIPADPGETYDPRSYINANSWTFAKTMPKHPHEYLLVHNSTDWREHMRFLGWLQHHGELERYGGLDYFGRVVDGHRYWRMSGRWRATSTTAMDLNECIINRRVYP
jgi:hypothetical protein